MYRPTHAIALLFILLFALASCIAGCEGVKVTMPMEVKDAPALKDAPVTAESLHRFKVKRDGVFEDSLAYNGKRGVYVITDTHTGKEFVGVSGIGVSEIGSHSTDGEGGTAEDER